MSLPEGCPFLRDPFSIPFKAYYPISTAVKWPRTELAGQSSVHKPQGQLLSQNIPCIPSNGCPPMAVPPTVDHNPPSNKPKMSPVSPKPDKSSLKEVSVRSSGSEDVKGLSMIVPIEVKGKPASAVIDTGAQVTIINSQFYDTLNLSFPSDPVLLKGINPEKSVEGYLVQEVPLTLGGKTYKWDLYVAPIEDQLLLGLDFMVHHKVDPLIS